MSHDPNSPQPPRQPPQPQSGQAPAQQPQPGQMGRPRQSPSYQSPLNQNSRFQPPAQGEQPAAQNQQWPGMQDHSGSHIQQRTYAESRFAPSNTQALRIRNQVKQHQGGPVDAPWTTQAIDINPAKDPTAKGDLYRLIGGSILGLILLLGFAGLLVYFALGSGSVTLVAVALLLTLLPLTVITLVVIWFDRWKRQPTIALVTAVLWGGVASVIMTLLIRTPFDIYFRGSGDEAVMQTWDILGTVAVAPILEEITKGIFLVVIVLVARRWFESPLDGWVYGSLIGGGFAFTENILYLQNAFINGAVATGSLSVGAMSLAITFFMRCIMSPFLHSTFVVCAGISIGLVAGRRKWWVIVLMWIPGLILGMILHAGWNGTSVLLGAMQLGFFGSMLIMGTMSAIVTLLWLGSGIYLQYNETKQTRANLGDYANAGWLTHAEVEMLGTFKGRRAGKNWAKRFPGALPFMKAMIKDSAELASTRMRVVAGVGGTAEQERERYLLDSFASNRRRMMKAVAKAGQAPRTQQPGMQPGAGAPQYGGPQQGTPQQGMPGQGYGAAQPGDQQAMSQNPAQYGSQAGPGFGSQTPGYASQQPGAQPGGQPQHGLQPGAQQQPPHNPQAQPPQVNNAQFNPAQPPNPNPAHNNQAHNYPANNSQNPGQNQQGRY